MKTAQPGSCGNGSVQHRNLKAKVNVNDQIMSKQLIAVNYVSYIHASSAEVYASSMFHQNHSKLSSQANVALLGVRKSNHCSYSNYCNLVLKTM